MPQDEPCDPCSRRSPTAPLAAAMLGMALVAGGALVVRRRLGTVESRQA